MERQIGETDWRYINKHIRETHWRDRLERHIGETDWRYIMTNRLERHIGETDWRDTLEKQIGDT